MQPLSTSLETASLPRIDAVQARLSPELDPHHVVGRGILHRAERTTDPALAARNGWFLHDDEMAREFLRLSQEVKNRSKQASAASAASQAGPRGGTAQIPRTTEHASAGLLRARPVETGRAVASATQRLHVAAPASAASAEFPRDEAVQVLQPELDPHSAEGKARLFAAGFEHLKGQEAINALVELEKKYQWTARGRAQTSAEQDRTKANNNTQPRRHHSRRGRPRKDSAVPGIYGNRKLDRCLQQAGLTAAERTIARKILSILRAEHLATGRGKFIRRSSLGSERTVKRTFSKLRIAQLITDSRPVKGQNQTRLTNLGPAFLGGLTGQHDGPKLAPQSRNFDTPRPIANTGDSGFALAPRFSHPLREGSYGAGPAASAPLRASASGPPPSPIHTKQNQFHSDQADQKQMTECHQNRSLDYGSVVRVKGHQSLYVVKGLFWGDTADDDSVRCASLDNPSEWLECKQRDVAVAD